MLHVFFKITFNVKRETDTNCYLFPALLSLVHRNRQVGGFPFSYCCFLLRKRSKSERQGLRADFQGMFRKRRRNFHRGRLTRGNGDKAFLFPCAVLLFYTAWTSDDAVIFFHYNVIMSRCQWDNNLYFTRARHIDAFVECPRIFY